MTIDAKATNKMLATQTVRVPITACTSVRPPNAAHAPMVKRSCQAKELKYLPPDGYADKFQSKDLAHM